MNKHYARSVASLLLLSLCLVGSATAQQLTSLFPEALVPFTGCSGTRCFQWADELQGDTVVVSNTAQRIVIFRASGSSWIAEQILQNPDIPSGGSSAEADLGAPLAFQGNWLLAYGMSRKYVNGPVVYVFAKQSGTWRHTQVLALPRMTDYPYAYVLDVVLDGSVALIHTLRYSDNSPTPASLSLIHVFIRNSDGRFQRRADLRPPTATESGAGYRVAIGGGTALVGDPEADEGRGAVYVYEQGTSGWPLRQILRAPNAAGGELYGTSLDIDGGRIAVGAIGVPNAVQPLTPGAVFLYERSGAAWALRQSVANPAATLDPSSPGEWWNFGAGVSLSGDRMLVGSQLASELPPFAYLFERRFDGWRAVAQLPNLEMTYPGHALVSGNRAVAVAGYDSGGAANWSYVLPLLGVLPVAP